ncbi:MAG: hypothetical protein PVJ76_17025 [Gemmatimonadota bacterium]|jgi:hypothetical protein
MRALNIALRTAHIGAMAFLLGGHAFDVSPERLQVSLWATIGTGVALGGVESGLRLLWLHQGRGLMTLGKLALLCLVPLAWDYRIPILLLVVVVASVGSHMSGRFRYYSIVYRRVIHDSYGPGGRKAREAEVGLKAADPQEVRR